MTSRICSGSRDLMGCGRRTQPRRCCPVVAAASAPPSGGGGGSTPQQQNAGSMDVSQLVVQPSFRSVPWEPEAADASTAARIALVSESGVCRSVLAAGALKAALASRGLSDSFVFECRASRDYCEGEGPDPTAASVAAERGWELPPGYAAQQFKEERDIVFFDMLLAMDKFVAADVLREVSVYDTIKNWGMGSYSSKVRRLGEFAPEAAAATATGSKQPADAFDIDDALYGNVEENAELEAVRAAAESIHQSCEGLADFFASVEQRHREAQQAAALHSVAAADGAAGSSSGSQVEGAAGQEEGQRLGEALIAAVRDLGAMEWLVPPMLQSR